MRFGLELSGTGSGHVASSCEHGNEPLGSIKWGNLLTSRGNFSVSMTQLRELTGWWVIWLVSW